jgi:hypothetical protein
MPPRQRASDAFAKVGHADAATAIEPAAPPPVPEAPDLDDALLGRWRWSLSAMARKAVAAQERAQVAVTAWERLVADARTAGIPERLVVAAAADAGLDVPGSE